MSNTLLVFVLLGSLSLLVGCGQSGTNDTAGETLRPGETASPNDGTTANEESASSNASILPDAESIDSDSTMEAASTAPQLSAPTGDLRFPVEVEAAMMGDQNQPALRATQPQIYLEPITPNSQDK